MTTALYDPAFQRELKHISIQILVHQAHSYFISKSHSPKHSILETNDNQQVNALRKKKTCGISTQWNTIQV